jgi:hypothetical protein
MSKKVSIDEIIVILMMKRWIFEYRKNLMKSRRTES